MIGAMPSRRASSERARSKRSEWADAGAHQQKAARAHLQDGWVLANHILVSFHAAFISSVLALPALDVAKAEVLRFIFVSSETLVSALFVYVTFHVSRHVIRNSGSSSGGGYGGGGFGGGSSGGGGASGSW